MDSSGGTCSPFIGRQAVPAWHDIFVQQCKMLRPRRFPMAALNRGGMAAWSDGNFWGYLHYLSHDLMGCREHRPLLTFEHMAVDKGSPLAFTMKCGSGIWGMHMSHIYSIIFLLSTTHVYGLYAIIQWTCHSIVLLNDSYHRSADNPSIHRIIYCQKLRNISCFNVLQGLNVHDSSTSFRSLPNLCLHVLWVDDVFSKNEGVHHDIYITRSIHILGTYICRCIHKKYLCMWSPCPKPYLLVLSYMYLILEILHTPASTYHICIYIYRRCIYNVCI